MTSWFWAIALLILQSSLNDAIKIHSAPCNLEQISTLGHILTIRLHTIVKGVLFLWHSTTDSKVKPNQIVNYG